MSLKQIKKQIKEFLKEKKTMLYPETKEVLKKEIEKVKRKNRGE